MKKIISVLLSFAFILSIVPVVHGAIATGGESMSFIFGASAYNSEVQVTNADLDTVDDEGEHSFNKGNASAPWKVDGMRYIKNMYAKTANDTQGNSLYWQVYKTRMDGSGVIIIHLNIEQKGKFVPSLTYQPLTNSYANDIYLIPSHKISDELEGKFSFYDANGKLNGNGNIVTFLAELSDTERAKYKLGYLQMRSSAKEKLTHIFDEYGEYEIDRTGSYYLILQANDTVGTSGNYYGQIYSFDLTPVATESIVLDSDFDYEEENYIGGNSSVRAFAVYGEDGVVTETEIIEVPDFAYGEICRISAPESSGDYNFLYWARGATMARKQIVSYNADFEFLPSEGVNYLLAVYESKSTMTSDKQEFYNANGQLLPELEIKNGVMPAYPSMAGYGKAKAWALKNPDGSYTEYYENDDAPPTKDAGTLLFVAVYDEPLKTVTITIDGISKEYQYGESVTCVPSVPADRVFLYWLRDGKPVSTEKEYTFNAWKTCELETVYGYTEPTLSKTMRKILLDKFSSGDNFSLMAEFIGFSDAVEKGIIYENRKIPMTSQKTQFTVTDDAHSAGEAVGYAIVKDKNGNLVQITDEKVLIGKSDDEILNERRDIAEAYMRESVSLLWSPKNDITYTIKTVDKLADADSEYLWTLKAGRIYRGLPYVYACGTPDAFLEYSSETDENGINIIDNLGWEAISRGNSYARIGNDCSGALTRAWQMAGSSVQSKTTKYMTEKYGFIKVGDYDSQYDDYTGGTIPIVTENGKERMFEAYTKLQKADAVVHWNGSGHTLMVVDVNVIRNEDGTINGDSSNIVVLEQTKRFFTSESSYTDAELGTVYRIGGVDVKHSFTKLYETGYLPITCREFINADYIDKPEFSDSISEYNKDTLLTGVISSNWSMNKMKIEIISNGSVLQDAMVSVARSNVFSFDMQQFITDYDAAIRGTGIDLSKLSAGTYNCKVLCYLTTGEVFTLRNFEFQI